mmetsp:Transcript_124090/g.215139  ORF Transcript_124090/g.215139 Transcript_124090/m.215139 type:complete len:123 (-) Transcript_124090:383-751(-)
MHILPPHPQAAVACCKMHNHILILTPYTHAHLNVHVHTHAHPYTPARRMYRPTPPPQESRVCSLAGYNQGWARSIVSRMKIAQSSPPPLKSQPHSAWHFWLAVNPLDGSLGLLEGELRADPG